MNIGNTSHMPSLTPHAMVESEGRWPRICALARWMGQQSEGRHVF
jgi:hypothetical protein